MIGAGVFTTSGFSLAEIGSRRWVLAAWAIGGLIAICGAISYGGLVKYIAESGGEYLFLSRVISPAAGFIAGWVSLLAGFTGAIAFAATAFESYALPESVRPWWWWPGTLAIASIVLFGGLHSLVTQKGLITQNVVVFVKLGLLIAFLIYASVVLFQRPLFDPLPADPDKPLTLFVMASALVWISLSYSGFNAAVYIAGEVKHAERIVPIALGLGTFLVMVMYLALNAVFLYAPDPAAIAGKPDVAAIAAESLGGKSLAFAVRLAICLALLSSVSSMIIVGPRVYAQMANDRVFPLFFRSEAQQGELKSPQASIWLQVVLASIVVAITTLPDLIAYLGFTLSISAALTVSCLFLLRRDPSRQQHRVVGYPVVPLIYVGATIVLAILAASNEPWQFAAAVITIGSGLLMYSLIRLFTSWNPAGRQDT